MNIKTLFLSIVICYNIAVIIHLASAEETTEQNNNNASIPITKDPATGKGFFAPILPDFVPSLDFILSPFLEEVDASKSAIKDIRKKMERQVEEMEDQGECAEENLEKTLFYSKKGKIYQGNPDCDPEQQYRYDRLNQLNGIYEYKDRHNFVLSNENYFQVENEDDDDRDDRKDNKKDRDRDDEDDRDEDDDDREYDGDDRNNKEEKGGINVLGDYQKDGLY